MFYKKAKAEIVKAYVSIPKWSCHNKISSINVNFKDLHGVYKKNSLRFIRP